MLSNRLCYPVTDFVLPGTILQLLNNDMQPLLISYSSRVSVSEARVLLVSSHQPQSQMLPNVSGKRIRGICQRGFLVRFACSRATFRDTTALPYTTCWGNWDTSLLFSLDYMVYSHYELLTSFC